MKECSKSIQRRLADSNFIAKYFVGKGLDIGGKPDPLALYLSLFPLAVAVRTWDREDGDAQFLEGIPDGSLDFVHASHCLEHLEDVAVGLGNWFRVIRPGGHLVFTVPDEDLYEQGVFPSTFNRDHKWTFTIFKPRSWSLRSINLVDLLKDLGPGADVLKVELLHASHRFDLPRYDQTLSPIGESAIEVVVRKRLPEEIAAGGRLPPGDAQPSAEIRRHLNQYRADLAMMKNANSDHPPFTDESELK
jgi:SAM-dependent methyltransferase